MNSTKQKPRVVEFSWTILGQWQDGEACVPENRVILVMPKNVPPSGRWPKVGHYDHFDGYFYVAERGYRLMFQHEDVFWLYFDTMLPDDLYIGRVDVTDQ